MGSPFQVEKQRFVGPGQKSLQAKRLDFIEQRRAPDGVQMRGDFVQQQYRIRIGFGTGKSLRLGQDQIENQGLLLAGGTFGGGPALLPMDHRQIAPVGAGQGPPGGGVAVDAGRLLTDD